MQKGITELSAVLSPEIPLSNETEVRGGEREKVKDTSLVWKLLATATLGHGSSCCCYSSELGCK